MVSIFIYIVIAVVAIYNFMRNYQKEQMKNAKRLKDMMSQSVPPPIQTHRPYEMNQTDDVLWKKDMDIYKEEEAVVAPYINTNSSVVDEVNDNLYNSKDIESILAKFEKASNTEEKEAFYVDTKTHSFNDANVSTNEPIDLGLNSAADYRRAFVHSLIFNRKY